MKSHSSEAMGSPEALECRTSPSRARTQASPVKIEVSGSTTSTCIFHGHYKADLPFTPDGSCRSGGGSGAGSDRIAVGDRVAYAMARDRTPNTRSSGWQLVKAPDSLDPKSPPGHAAGMTATIYKFRLSAPKGRHRAGPCPPARRTA